MRSFLEYLRAPSGAVAFMIVVAVGFVATEFEVLGETLQGIRGWQADEIFSLFMVVLLALLLLLVLRWGRSLEVASRKTAEAETEALRLALHDPLTGLPNRHCFHQHVEEALSQTRPGDIARPLAILLDLDRFKLVNDLRGHEAGDRLLCEVASRLRRVCPEDGLVARLGGDEFAVTLCAVEMLRPRAV